MAKWVFDGQRFMPDSGGNSIPEYDAPEYAGSLTGNEGDQQAVYERGPHKGQSLYADASDEYKSWYEDYKIAHSDWPVPVYGGGR